MTTVSHTHLDRQRRPPGECPACDVAWERQRAKADKVGKPSKAEREVIAMTKREGKLGTQRYGHKPGADRG